MDRRFFAHARVTDAVRLAKAEPGLRHCLKVGQVRATNTSTGAARGCALKPTFWGHCERPVQPAKRQVDIRTSIRTEPATGAFGYRCRPLLKFRLRGNHSNKSKDMSNLRQIAIEEARAGFAAGGIPIASVLAIENEKGVATLERRPRRRGIGGAGPDRCGIASSDQNLPRDRWPGVVQRLPPFARSSACRSVPCDL
jgi:hypothetical protein